MSSNIISFSAKIKARILPFSGLRELQEPETTAAMAGRRAGGVAANVDPDAGAVASVLLALEEGWKRQHPTYTRGDIADALRVSESTLSRIFQGTRPVRPADVARIASYFRTTSAEVYRLAEGPLSPVDAEFVALIPSLDQDDKRLVLEIFKLRRKGDGPDNVP